MQFIFVAPAGAARTENAIGTVRLISFCNCYFKKVNDKLQLLTANAVLLILLPKVLNQQEVGDFKAEEVSVKISAALINRADINTIQGTWRSFVNLNGKDLMKVSSKIGIPEAATIAVNPCTAYRMLKDFVNLKPGDTVIQNGANSAVGQAVHQLCAAWGIKSVGVVRDGPEIDNLRKYLIDLGATEILTEEEIRRTNRVK